MNANIIRILFLIGISLLSSTTASAEESAASRLRLQLAEHAASRRVMFGHHDDTVYGHDWTGESGRSDILEVTGLYPALMSWDFGGIENDSPVNLDGVPFYRIQKETIAQDARGGINTFSWHPTLPGGEGSSWSIDDPTTVSRILRDPQANRWFTDAVERIAAFFNSLKDADGDDIAVIFRPWHELTGSWFWWGRDLCSTDDYVALWNLTRDIMDRQGVDNVLWAYAPDKVTCTADYMERYPGDDLVDIVGTDVYHFNGAEGADNYLATARASLHAAAEVAAAHGKVLAFTETGLEGLPIADWYTTLLLPLLKSYPVAYVTVWRNAFDNKTHFYTPYPGHPAMQDFRSFAADPSIVMVPAQ